VDDPEQTPVTRDELMLILHSEGAYCGLCDYENAVYPDQSDGVEWACRDCERCLSGYVEAILAKYVVLPKETK
jgi:hypothetical protein